MSPGADGCPGRIGRLGFAAGGQIQCLEKAAESGATLAVLALTKCANNLIG
jgi:hypothetical protein